MHEDAPGHRRITDGRELASSLVPIVNHALLMGTLTGQAFISSNIDCRIWLSSLVQESVEISVLDQTGIVDLVRGGIKHRIVYTREGSVCRAAVLPKGKKICLGQRVMLIRSGELLCARYLKYYLVSEKAKQLLANKQRGVTVSHINVADVIKLPIPLPPLAEQKRIIAKLEELLPLCE